MAFPFPRLPRRTVVDQVLRATVVSVTVAPIGAFSGALTVVIVSTSEPDVWSVKASWWFPVLVAALVSVCIAEVLVNFALPIITVGFAITVPRIHTGSLALALAFMVACVRAAGSKSLVYATIGICFRCLTVGIALAFFNSSIGITTGSFASAVRVLQACAGSRRSIGLVHAAGVGDGAGSPSLL